MSWTERAVVRPMRVKGFDNIWELELTELEEKAYVDKGGKKWEILNLGDWVRNISNNQREVI